MPTNFKLKEITMQSADRKKRATTITNVFYGVEDHGMLTCWLQLSRDGGGTQGFGGLDAYAADFVKSVCELFNVQDLEDLIGKKCYALYSFGYLNDAVEGIETEDGRRFTLTSFLKKHETNVKSRLEREKKYHYSIIESSIQRIVRESNQLKSLEEQYTDWDNTP